MFLRMILFVLTGIQLKCQALLTISKYATEGTEGIMQCDFHLENSTVHVVWYNDRDPNISVCNYPGYCQFPNHQRYEAFINNRYSSFVISAASYYEDDERWYCNVNGLASSVNFTVTSIPKDFRFTNPPISGVSIPDDGVTLNATAVCLYPKPSNATMLYRIKGDQHYNVFQRRSPVIEFSTGHSGNCLSHQSVMTVSNNLFNADFDFVIDTSVLFQFSYKLQSGIEKTTEDVVDLKFSSSREIRTSTSTINAKTEITTQPASPGKLQNKSSEEWIIPVAVIITLLLIALIAIPIVYRVQKSRKGLSSGTCIFNSYEQFDGSGSEISTPRSGMRSQETLQGTPRENRNKTNEENTETEAQTSTVHVSSTTKQGEYNHGKGRNNKGKGDESANSRYHSKTQNVSAGKRLGVDKNSPKISTYPNDGLFENVNSKQTTDPLETNYPDSSSVSSNYEDRRSRRTRGEKWRMRSQTTDFMDMFLLDPSNWSD